MLVSANLQRPTLRYPAHSDDLGMEQEIHCAIEEIGVPDGWTYLPVYWTNNYHAYGFHPVAEAQSLLNNLQSDQKYFTVVQCDDGIYENIPPNVTVFGGGGVGDVPIPLLCKKHEPLDTPRTIVASFRGQIECGGPEHPHLKAKRSTWDPNGPGATTRRAMRDQLGKYGDISIDGRPGNTHIFRELMSQSHFALCPRGYGRTSFRLYEAMDFLAVPVYIYDEPWTPFPELPWDTFSVHCPIGELPQLRNRLLDRLDHIEAMRTALREVRHRFTYQGTAQWIINYLNSPVATNFATY